MNELHQLSLFKMEDEHQHHSSDQIITPALEDSIIEEIIPYEINDRVKIRNSANLVEDPESFFYLKEFEGKRGEVRKIIEKPVLQYEVAFGQRIAIVYHQELSIGWQ